LVGENAVAVGDNRVIRALAGVNSILFDFSSAGGLAAARVTIGDYAAAIISLNAARTSAARDEAEQKGLILENVQNRLDSQTGVNVDEELATLVVFQNAYVMAARVLKTATEMLDVLNDMVN
jgi:flagellar hook-associated protein 1 FlgK